MKKRANKKAKITYRGWAGHFICGPRCEFHLNTLIEFGRTKIVVSTVGRLPDSLNRDKYTTIGLDRHYETMAFHAEKNGEFWDMNVNRPVDFKSQWSWSKISDEWKANKGHWATVKEIAERLERRGI